MNNKNRGKLRYQIYYLENIYRNSAFEELENILDKIENFKEQEENNFERLEGGLREYGIGKQIEENIEIFSEAMEMVEILRENIKNFNEAIEFIREAI